MHATGEPVEIGTGWIGRPIPKASVIAAMAIPLVTSMTMQLEPMLLTELARNGRIAVDEIGKIATADFALTGLVTFVAVAKLPYDHVRGVTILGALLIAVANAVSGLVPSTAAILASRFVAGCASGLFMWLLIGLLTRSTLPARLNGIYLAVQGLVSLVLAAAFGTMVLPRLGAEGGFLVLAGSGVVAAIGATALVPTFDPPRHQRMEAGARMARPGYLALLAILLSMAAIFSLWVHFPPLAAQLGYPGWAEKTAVPVAIGAEVVGGVMAAALARRADWLWILRMNFVAVALVAAAFCLVRSPVVYVAASALIGFLWMFTTPFEYPFAMAADPTRHAVNYVTPVQLVGSGVGPMIASLGVVGGDVRGAMLVAAGLIVVALAVLITLDRRRATA